MRAAESGGYKETMSEETHAAVDSQRDEAIAHYLALHPWDYYDLERIEFVPPLAYLVTATPGAGQDRELRLALRAPATAGRLTLTFFGVEQLRFEPQGDICFHLSITSIRDRQWERLKYLVHEEEHDTLRFYCAQFEAATPEVDGTSVALAT
jgi:hypothetical protein